MQDISLDVQNIVKHFTIEKRKSISKTLQNKDFPLKQITAIDGISFKAKKGEILGIIGLNGSGKTTLLRTIAGIYQPDSGKIIRYGSIAPILQLGSGFNLDLTASENIILYGMLLGMSKLEIKRKINEILKFAELEQFTTMKLKHFSTGMLARLAFSTVLQINPDIFLLDEILSVGDIRFREKTSKVFQSFKENGKTVLYTTHNINTLPEICDRVLLIHKGKGLMIGNPEEVVKKYREISKL